MRERLLTKQGEDLGGGGDPPGALGHGRQLLWPGRKEPCADEELQALHQLLKALRREPDEEEEQGNDHIHIYTYINVIFV